MLIRDIIVSAVQPMLMWEDRDSNLKNLERLIDGIGEKTDLVVLPEMFTTGFSMHPEKLAEKKEGPTLQWMRAMAAKKNAVITGSIMTEENGRYLNDLLWVAPDGSYHSYAKRHLFRMAGEEKKFAMGTSKLIVDLHGWKICPLVCYDLRFPVWSRNRWTQNGNELTADYDVLLYVANWPEVRSNVWKTLLLARAMENQAYVVGVNRIGNDGNFMFHSGDSAIIDFKGGYLKTAIMGKEEVITSVLSRQLLNEFRTGFPAGMDADKFRIE